MHKAIISIMKAGINSMTDRVKKKQIINPKEIKDYREMLKAEKLEPTKVNKLDADNLNAGHTIIMVTDKVNNIL